jgi:uncharacterized phiE125 gp8 family phage protein
MFKVYSQPATEPITAAEVMQHCRIDDSNQEPSPGAVTVALGSGAGNVDNGAHRYAVTFVTSSGETQAGDISAAVTVADKTVNGKVSLSGIPLGGSLVTSRKLYRTTAGGSTYLLLATIADNTTTTYTDNIADASLGAEAPSTNTTDDPYLSILIMAARQHAEQELNRYLITQTVDAYFDAFPEMDKNGDIAIKLPPLQSVTSITYIDTDGTEQTLATDQYTVDSASIPARITPAYNVSWPSTREQTNAVKVRFVAGYGTASDVPGCIKHWMLMRIKTLYDTRDQTVFANGLPVIQQSFIDGLLDPERVRGYL